MGGNLYYLVKLLPVILFTAALFGGLGWWLRGRTVPKPVVEGKNRRRSNAISRENPVACDHRGQERISLPTEENTAVLDEPGVNEEAAEATAEDDAEEDKEDEEESEQQEEVCEEEELPEEVNSVETDEVAAEETEEVSVIEEEMEEEESKESPEEIEESNEEPQGGQEMEVEPEATVEETENPFALATELWGRRVEADDLTAVLGVSTRISKALRGAGIDTWKELAEADGAKLRRILAQADKRFVSHDPDDWPKQAKMMLDGEWEELRAWQDEHRPTIAKKLKTEKPE